MDRLFVSWSEESRVSFQMQKLEVLFFQLLIRRKCDPLMVFIFLVNLNALKSLGPTLGKASGLRPLRYTSLSLVSLWEVV